MIKLCFVIVLAFVVVRASKLEIPSFAVIGEKAVLECEIDHGNTFIESVIWYKDNHAFFIYTPSEPNPLQTFPVDGVDVDKGESGLTRLVLRTTTVKSPGIYICEAKLGDSDLGMARLTGTLVVVPRKSSYAI